MSIDPKILKRMQGEDAFLQSQSRGNRRVKLERGQSWTIRFLPAKLGPDGLWFARIARHWNNKLPITCPRNTAMDFGGDPDCECPVCTVCDELNADRDEAISKIGYKAMSTPQFLTYCLVFDKDGVQQPLSEVLNPYEFWHYRSTFEELKAFYMAGGRKCMDSILDFEQGNDFVVSKGGKGMRLDKQDSAPIFTLDDPKYNEHIKKIMAACKPPKVTIPTAEQMQQFADKLQESAHRGGGDVPRRGAVRGGYADDGDDDEAAFRRPARSARPAVEDDVDDAPARPAGRRAAPEADEQDEAPRARRSAPVEHEVEAPRRPARANPAHEAVDDDDDGDLGPQRTPPKAQPKPIRRSEPVDDDASNEPAEESEPPAKSPVRNFGQTSKRSAAATPAKSEATGTPQAESEEEDNLPEDDTDPVPPAPKRTAAPVDAEPEEDDDVPTPVARGKGAGTESANRLRARLTTMPADA
jgi:hypothetical protein